MAEVLSFDDAKVLEVVETNKGKAVLGKARFQEGEATKERLLANLQSDIAILQQVRRGEYFNPNTGLLENCRDVSFGEYMQERYGFEWNPQTGLPTEYLRQLGANPQDTTIERLTGSLGGVNPNYRFLVPEILLEAARLGLRRKPYYRSLIRREESVSQQTVSIPQINESNIEFTKIGEGETIPTGSITYNQKQVRAYKYGAGIRLTDEVMRMSRLNILSDALESAGALQGFGMDRMAIKTLLQGDGLTAVPAYETGVQTTGKFTARDFNKLWLRLTRMGLNPTCIVAGEDVALDLLEIAQFSQFNQLSNGKPQTTLKLAGLPESQDIFAHNGIPANKALLVCGGDALMKLNVQALTVKETRDNSNDTTTYYMTETCGFVVWKNQARILLDNTKAFATNGFHASYDLSRYEDMTK